jgi:endonuclease V-like protein UPF0215 family
MSRSPSRSTNRSLRIVGVDDGAIPAIRRAKQRALLVAVLLHGSTITAARLGSIEVDGRDVNLVLNSLLKTVRFDAVMLSGISFGGFNLVDIRELARFTRKPVIVICREKPNNDAVRRALRKHFADWAQRWRIIQNAGKLYAFRPLSKEPQLYFEVKGASPSFAKEAIASAAEISRLPEPIRVAGMVAKGLNALTAHPRENAKL